MADSPTAVIRRLPPPSLRRDAPRRPREPQPQAPPISNARLAVVVLLVAEAMFFSGLIGAYLVFRVGSTAWPPPNLPRLPLVVTWLNTAVLLASGVTMVRARRAATRNDSPALLRNLAVTAGLGVLFLVVQGSEWVRLVHHGLTLSAGPYGATFYVLIGTHALHVVGAVLWLGLVWMWSRRGLIGPEHDGALDACAIYWIFVCALWVVLFALVYG
jgi:heme/copper-type cytochrome/quinol oxidase subunit 3